MHNANDFMEAMKKIAVDANESGQPCDFCFGVVMSEEPNIQIMVEQKMLLKPAQLILTRNVTDFKTKTTITEEYEWETRTADGHDHKIIHEKKWIKIHNKLKVGERVVLLKKKGGQKYLVIDRMPE